MKKMSNDVELNNAMMELQTHARKVDMLLNIEGGPKMEQWYENICERTDKMQALAKKMKSLKV